MKRIVSLNCNGIRSAAKKGMFEWMADLQPDVLCLQEIKCQADDLKDLEQFAPAGWHVHLNGAIRKGYSGTAIYSRVKPNAVLNTLGATEFDDEGRYIETRFGDLSVISLYLPSGSAGPERQESKDRFLAFFEPKLREMMGEGREYIVCGDWNIAHTQKDLKNWRSNQKNSGFLPHERAWLGDVLGSGGWVDAYRTLYPDAEGEGYTWWSNRGNAWENNVGWRIDYQLITPGLRDKLLTASVHKSSRFSDHAPLIIDYDI